MRRRALLAASAASGGGKDWSYELHLTPEWETENIITDSAYIFGDYEELYNLVLDMCKTLGSREDFDYNTEWRLNDIPQEFNFTIDGYRARQILVYSNIETVEVSCNPDPETLADIGKNIIVFYKLKF